jgi:hypothetical protein
MGLSPAARLLLAQGLRSASAAGPVHQPGAEPLGLATLVAAEHALLLLAAVMPDGQRRRAELAERAVIAAEDRLAALTEESPEVPD